ncbi:MAG: flagellar assembly protein FliH [Candidatus Accumulibacter sp.]|jgi:flagellar assembly protein FliH|nr:flagellar assembly protein FliH [Accumulibacter sp.]
MPGFIPREKLTAYQRWELAAFDEKEQTVEPPENAAEPPQAAETPPPPPEEEPPEQVTVALPTAAEIERIHDEAREQGYAEGHSAGSSAGYSAGYASGQSEGLDKARDVTARLAEILESLEQAVGEIEQRVAEQLLSTAVEIASQVLRQSLRVKPELILPVVREAVDALQFGSGHPALLAHPDDAALIREHLGDQLAHNNWRIIDDPTLTRGGCRVELGASEVDASMETRWKRVIETIGVQRDWLDDKS